LIDPAAIIDRVRAHGANIVLDNGQLLLINRAKLPPEAAGFVRKHRTAIAALLRQDEEAEFEERAAVIQYDGKTPRAWAEQFARILTDRRPKGIDDLDWSYFLTACGRIIDETPDRRAA
jgi:hypothetical protein